MSAHTHASSTPTPEMPPATPAVASPTTPMSDKIASRRTIPLFAVALAIVGTLPIGLGVGLACRAKSIALAELATESLHDEVSANDETAPVSWAWRNQPRADDLFRAGDFRLALQLYQSKECADSLQPSAELPLKIALCHEILGQWDEAHAILGPFTEHHDSNLRAAALLAQSRICLRRHDLDKARATLSQLLCRSDNLGRDCQPDVVDDGCFLLAIACLIGDGSLSESSDPVRPVSPLHRSTWQESDVLLLENSTTMALDPETQELVTRLLAATAADQRQSLGEQFAMQLLAKNSAHRLVGHLHLALGEAAYQRGDLAEAVARYGEASSRSSTALSTIAAFNQGVVRFQLHEYHTASLALGRFINGAPGHEFGPRAWMLRGRALLELGAGELAAFDLKRAADLPGRDDERAWATVYLGLANLQARKPKVAAREMFQRRDRLQSGIARSETALVVSLARLESLESSDSRDREALFMLRGLATVNPDAEWLGACGRLMIGRAYQHLGLVDQAAEIYEQALRQEVQEPFASEMKLALAEHALAFGDPSQGLALLAELRATQQAPWSVAAHVRTAEWELSHGRERECLTICQELLLQDFDHAPILRLMGSAYERAGDHAQAAECFAGVAR